MLGTPELMQTAAHAADIIRNSDFIRIISHYDADGLASAGIIAESLRRLCKGFHLSTVHDLDSKLVERLGTEKNALTIFCDTGSGQIELLQKLGKVIICEHHKPDINKDRVGNIIQINAHIFGVDGTYEASGSAISFLLATALSDKYWDLCYLALAGALGDRQGVNGLRGLNREILEEGMKRGYIAELRDLKLGNGSISECISKSSDPFFCGLSSDREKAKEFLKSAGIRDIGIKELSEVEKTKLLSLLSLRLIKQGARAEMAERMIGSKYIWKGMDCNHIADVLNACGRSGKESLGVSLCLNFEKYKEEAEALLDSYEKRILEGVKKIYEEGAKELKGVQYSVIQDQNLAGTIMGLALNSFLNQEKPALGISYKNDETRISARGTRYLIGKGLDLAYALKASAEFAGGHGGGHPIAAGATIPKERTEEFLKKLDEIVCAQLNPFKSALEMKEIKINSGAER